MPTTVRSIRPNNTVSKTVIKVTSEIVDLHEGRRLFRGCAIKALIYKEGNHSDTYFNFPEQKTIKILTLPSEDSWPASTGLLWLYCSFFQDSLATLWLITSKTVQPTDNWSIINNHYIFKNTLGSNNLCLLCLNIIIITFFLIKFR